LNPFVPNANIHGDKYQWGYKNPYIKQKYDAVVSGPVPGWNAIKYNNTWDKGVNDPCPNGYRIPSESELSGMVNNSPSKRIGDWNDIYRKSAKAGVMFGDNLMLPTVGIRFADGSTITTINGRVWKRWSIWILLGV